MANEEAPPVSEDAAVGSKSKLPLIAVIVAGIAVGAGSGVMIVGPIFSRKFAAAAIVASADSAGAGSEEKAAGGGEHEGGKPGAAAAAPPVLLLENMVLNPAGSGGARYLLMSVAIECKDQKGVETLTLRDPELRDVILSMLGRKSIEELSDVGQREAIKTEVSTAISERFGKNIVKQLYFPQFVLQ
jgi:flagellar FliL protein